ncbi:MAG TPA: glutamate 5-kinase [Anaerolineaceae bacterium]|nr:glutamate 5-kinase [Anaerolineaceae bacterium]
MENNRIVVKFGTSTLTAGGQQLSLPRVLDLVRQISTLNSRGCQVVLVSSGAIAAGKEALNYIELPRFIPAKQMLAAVGQPRLMGFYQQFFSIYGLSSAQVLLTRADLSDRRHYLNSRNTVDALLDHGIIPIINENDTVATEEIRFGDNDYLSALVASLVEADLLVLLTDQPGLYTGDPRKDPMAHLIPEVTGPEIPEDLWQAAGGSSNGLGTGGMFTKLKAADLARRSGTLVYIASGSDPDILVHAAAGEPLGTRFPALITHLESRKRYLLTGGRSQGKIVVDDGAARALAQGSSLLPVGVKKIQGQFDRGDTVRVLSPKGKEIAVGLVGYNSKDLEILLGRQSSEIETLLGYTFGDEVIHRNNLLLL